jgi:chromosome partitioning protein
MRILAFLSQKGGSGKTTLHTAVTAHESGVRVVLIDTDPQCSAGACGEAREESEPTVLTAGFRS